jgi:hypothetical protein
MCWLDDYPSKKSARNHQQIWGFEQVFIREQYDAESEHLLDIARQSSRPIVP